MKRLLALLLLAVMSAAFAQQTPQYDYTVTNPTYTGLENINQQNQGIPTNLGDDGTVAGISIGFDFDFYGETFSFVNLSSNGLISFKNNINGCCSGELLPSNQYYDFGIFGIWTDLVNIGTANPYYRTFGEEGDRRFVVGWYDQAMFYDGNQRSSFEITLFEGSNNILLNYADVNLNRQFTAGIQGYGSQGQFEQIYFGANGNTLDNTSWLLSYSALEPPPPPPEAPIAPDCTINPSNPSCIINALIPGPTDEEFLADTGFDNGSDDGSSIFTEDDEDTTIDDSVAEKVFVAEEIADEEMIDEDLEELLAEEVSEDEEGDAVETVAVAKSLENEEKASVLSDSISKDVLEAALSIAADVTAAGSVAGESTSTSSSSSSSSRVSSEQQETMAAEITSSSSESSNEETTMASNEGDVSAELLETGRVMGQEALAATLEGSEASANESMTEAETISATAAEASITANNDLSVTGQSENVSAAADEIQTQEENIMIADIAESIIDNVVAEASIQTETSTETSFDVGKEMMAENAEQMATADAQDAEALSIVAAAAASSEQKFDDDSLKDAELTNAMVDPAFAMSNTFNQAPSMMSLDFLGVLKPIEKSDAEIRAEQVVAANKEQQDAINANYMDADQSGIVSAIAVDADVSSYLTQRIPDVPFYRPEDIYKNIVIRDNVRGSYFLEKGNTDTYKKMIEEQYKDE